MSNSTLAAIQTKVRRLTRSPSTAQISDAQINEYINTFVLYDFPEHLRLFSLKKTFTFYTQPFQDEYPTDEDSFAGVLNNPLYNFRNRYVTVHPPLYIAGYESQLSQNREQFFRIYPFTNLIVDTQLRGDGLTVTFNGTVNPGAGVNNQVGGTVLLQSNVTLSSITAAGSSMAMIDTPVTSTVYGNKLTTGNLSLATNIPTVVQVATDVLNNINYTTGLFTITFPTAPANGAPIIAEVVPLQAARPLSVLYYGDTFTVRPVPDKVYPINFDVYVRPTELLASNQSPELEQWWQWVSYGAAKKIFEDRMDMDSVQLIMPEYKQQERLVLRRTLVQQSNERVATIYTDNSAGAYGSGWFFGGGQF